VTIVGVNLTRYEPSIIEITRRLAACMIDERITGCVADPDFDFADARLLLQWMLCRPRLDPATHDVNVLWSDCVESRWRWDI